jgi:8-oxo-dGTP diphosphatase
MLAPAARLFVTTEVVIFTILTHRLRVLVVTEGNGGSRLPGGPASLEEDLDATAERHLRSETGIYDVYLEQLYTFGRQACNPERRNVSVAYYALAPLAKLSESGNSNGTRWFELDQLPSMVQDHDAIVAMAHRRLVAKLSYSTIALQLMPRAFTLRMLQDVYEAILGDTLDKRNFRKRIQGLDCLEDTGELARQGRHRPAKLYRLKQPDHIAFTR